MSTLPKSFGNLSNLERLHLDSNKIQELPDILGKLPKLSRLSLSDNPLDKDILKYEFLLSMKNLNIVYFSKTPLEAVFKQPNFWGNTKQQLEKAVKARKNSLLQPQAHPDDTKPGSSENADQNTVDPGVLEKEKVVITN